VATPRVALDPAFASTLRHLREARGWSYRVLAAHAFITSTYAWELENGRKTRPTLKSVASLDAALEADGALLGLAHPAAPPVAEPDDHDRIVHAVKRPSRLDPKAVDALTEVLAVHRRLDDTMPAHILIPGEVAQWETVLRLARDARGPAACRLRDVAAEWTQYVGWLHAEARQDAPAIRTLTEGVKQAADIGSGPLTAQAHNFLGYVQRQRGNPRGTVEHFEGAYRTPGATRLQRIGDAAQAAQGYALLGDRPAALKLLGEAQELALNADEDKPPVAAYWLSTTFGRLNLGLAYLALGDRHEAAEQLRAGLAGLPEDQRGSEWAAEYQRALTTAEQGSPQPCP
jgi:transcriptional regulator with XRE-family HTH domain